jgi:hypothetical protein
MKYIYTGLLNRNHAAFNVADREIAAYNLIPGEVYIIFGTHGMKYIGTITNDIRHQYISEQLVSIYFKSLDEVRDNKISEVLA